MLNPCNDPFHKRLWLHFEDVERRTKNKENTDRLKQWFGKFLKLVKQKKKLEGEK